MYKCRVSERLGSILFKTHLAHEPVVGPGFEANVPGTRWLALNDPQHECTPMPFQRTANRQIISKFLQQGTWSWTKTHLEIIQFKSWGAEDCLQPPSGALKLWYCVFFHLFIRVLVEAILSILPPPSMIKHDHPGEEPLSSSTECCSWGIGFYLSISLILFWLKTSLKAYVK